MAKLACHTVLTSNEPTIHKDADTYLFAHVYSYQIIKSIAAANQISESEHTLATVSILTTRPMARSIFDFRPNAGHSKLGAKISFLK
jgi:hypothetical protein